MDFWKDQAVLTNTVRRPLLTQIEQEPSIGQQIAPLLPIRSRAVKMRVEDTYAFGLGQFKAPEGALPLVKPPKESWREEIMELVLQEEGDRISPEHWMRMNSPNEETRRRAGLDLVRRGQLLQMRNERLTEWMRWQAFAGSLLVRYPDQNSEILINYGLPTGHQPTAGTAWTDLNAADPLANIEAWQEQVADSSGFYGTQIHMNTNTWKFLAKNAKVKAQFTPVGGVAPFVVRVTDVLELLREDTQFIFYDKGYRAESQGANRGPTAHTRYLPDGKVLMTTTYSIDGEKIADMPDGEVEISTGFNSTAIRQGIQSEIIITDHGSKNRVIRQASARIPRLLHPECFLWATVY